MACIVSILPTILYNWNADNFNYYSGNVEVSGNPDIRLGNILDVIDGADLDANGYPGRRYYIESVINTFTLSFFTLVFALSSLGFILIIKMSLELITLSQRINPDSRRYGQ